MTDGLKQSLQAYFQRRLETQGRTPIESGTLEAALQALNRDEVEPVVGALVCEITNPKSLGNIVTEATMLHDQLVTEIDEEDTPEAQKYPPGVSDTVGKVHYMEAGRMVCGAGTPQQLPASDRTVTYHDSINGRGVASLITCPRCLSLYQTDARL